MFENEWQSILASLKPWLMRRNKWLIINLEAMSDDNFST